MEYIPQTKDALQATYPAAGAATNANAVLANRLVDFIARSLSLHNRKAPRWSPLASLVHSEQEEIC